MKRFFPLQISKYIAREFSFWFLGIFLVILALIFLLEFSELLRRSQGHPGATYYVIMEMAFLKLPHLSEELLPFTLFFAAILCLWRLSRNHELMIIRSVGVSVWQFLMPIVLVSFSIGVVDLCVVNPLSSVMKQRYDTLDSKYLHQKQYSLKVSESGIWVRQVSKEASIIYRIGKVDVEKKIFHDISLYRYDRSYHFIERIDAKSGQLMGKELQLNQAWILKNGQLPENHVTINIPSELTVDKLAETNISPDSMSFWELSSFIYLLEKSGLLRSEYKLYWHALLARVFWLVAMIFLAGACVLHSVRQGKLSLFIFFGIVSGFGLYVLKDVTYVMGAASTIPVILAAWTPVIVTFMAGVSVLLYLEDG